MQVCIVVLSQTPYICPALSFSSSSLEMLGINLNLLSLSLISRNKLLHFKTSLTHNLVTGSFHFIPKINVGDVA